MLSVVCCPVSGEPVRRRAMQACRWGAVYSSSKAGLAREYRYRGRVTGCWVKRGGRVRWSKIPGAGGRRRWPGLVVRLRRLQVIGMTLGGTSSGAAEQLFEQDVRDDFACTEKHYKKQQPRIVDISLWRGAPFSYRSRGQHQ
ncbi:hypothetical protein BU25DRAFT_76760 [Macroventuria anomochaeta]|uniref:Uncharacterized protein n=1 Tax=Macroventuria anomochaeta TaxID=301207 RepID=A0ACB6SGV1_9PLEO|nr:uncharacterized protein BU25DRAFT_76760 [Macroventuria anomochaeta]KAF2632549.1 hypothetical protein BU25DRAFT_76760 [Macroventuria anomochaeta]